MGIFTLSFFSPAYYMPPFIEHQISDNITANAPEKMHILYGYQCAFWVTMSMFESPIAFIGNLSNIIVLTIVLLQMLQVPGRMVFLRSASVVLGITGTLIWPVVIRTGLQLGYYLWAFSTIALCIFFIIKKPFTIDYEETVLDESLLG